MPYVVRKHRGAGERKPARYVAQPGSKRSYTTRLQNARVFPTREAAQADACGNESIIDTRVLFGVVG